MKLTCLFLAFGSLVSAARAQVPGVPGAGAGAAAGADAGAVPAAAAPAGAQPTTLWSFLGLSPENCAKCRAKLCPSGLATMARSMLSPARMITGGLLPPCCPAYPNAEDINKALQSGAMSPAEAAAAKIKADEAGAKARRAAVRYLGTVDCHFYPEAESGIISALRSDRIECVRMEAALALLNGCCCTKKTLEALALVVSGSDKDGNPAETSERVKCIAELALHRCMSAPLEFDGAVAPLEPPELPAPGVVAPAGYNPSANALLQDPIFAEARRLHAEHVAASNPQQKLANGNRSLYQIFQQARTPAPEAPTTAAAPKSATAPPPPPPPLTPIGVLPASFDYAAPVAVNRY